MLYSRTCVCYIPPEVVPVVLSQFATQATSRADQAHTVLQQPAIACRVWYNCFHDCTFVECHDVAAAAVHSFVATSTISCQLYNMQDHLTGKQYLGWKAIRDEQTRLQEHLASQRLPPPPAARTEDSRSAHRDRERDHRDRDHRRDRERSHSSREQHHSRHASDRHQDGARRSSSHRDETSDRYRTARLPLCHAVQQSP